MGGSGVPRNPAADDTDPGHDADAVSSARLERLTRELDAVRGERDAARRRLRAMESSAAPGVAGALKQKARGVKRRLDALRGRGASAAVGATAAVSAGERPTPLRAPESAGRVERSATPDVTVVIPVFDSEAFLDDCLSSVLAQTGVTIEVICINDGSTDGSRAVLQRYADADPRVSIIDQENQGQSVGRNAGLDAAAGRYLIYLDSDDFWPADTLAGLVRRADDENLDVLLFDCLSFLDGEVAAATWKRYSTYYQRSHAYAQARSGAEMIADMRRNRDYRPHVGMYLARTAFVREVGARFIPGIIHQDNPYTFALLLNAERVAHEATDIYARRIRPGSTITTLRDARSVVGYYRSYVAMIREIQGKTFTPEVDDMLAEVVYGVFDGASKKVASLTHADFTALADLEHGVDARVALEALRAFRTR